MGYKIVYTKAGTVKKNTVKKSSVILMASLIVIISLLICSAISKKDIVTFWFYGKNKASAALCGFADDLRAGESVKEAFATLYQGILEHGNIPG